jgi:hypothetical protein
MVLKRFSIWLILAAFIATTAGLVFEGAWAQEEPALQTTVRVGEPTLVAKGAGVSVPVIYTCTAAPGVTVDNAFLSVSVRQAVKKQITTGQSFQSFTPICDGAEHTIEALVFAGSSGGPALAFAKGPAIVSAFLEVSGTDPSGGEYGSRVFATANTTTETRIR